MDFAFGKIFLILIVGMLVLGPQKMIHAARVAGFWVAKIRQMSENAKQQWNDISAANELKELKNQFEQAGKTVQEHVQSTIDQVQEIKQEVEEQVSYQIEPISNAFSNRLSINDQGYPEPGRAFSSDSNGAHSDGIGSYGTIKRSARKQLDYAHPMSVASSHTDGRSLRQKKASLQRTTARLTRVAPVRKKL